MTPNAILARIKQQKKDAVERFKNNKYVTIHDYSGNSNTNKCDPFSVWVDLNFPIYVERNGKPILVDGMKDIRIKYSTGYPETRPTVYVPENIVSVHCWGDRTLCLHTKYSPESNTLIQELEKLMCLAANCPESINYNSMCRPMAHYKAWTEENLKNGNLPTIKKSVLLPQVPTRTRRQFNFV